MYQRNAAVDAAPLESELMLYHPTTTQFYMLNPTMVCIWRSCEAPKAFEALVDAVLSEFDGAERPTVESDVRLAVDQLVSLGLLFDVTTQPV